MSGPSRDPPIAGGESTQADRNSKANAKTPIFPSMNATSSPNQIGAEPRSGIRLCPFVLFAHVRNSDDCKSHN